MTTLDELVGKEVVIRWADHRIVARTNWQVIGVQMPMLKLREHGAETTNEGDHWVNIALISSITEVGVKHDASFFERVALRVDVPA